MAGIRWMDKRLAALSGVRLRCTLFVPCSQYVLFVRGISSGVFLPGYFFRGISSGVFSSKLKEMAVPLKAVGCEVGAA
jgi:hypothetical protein